MKKIIIISYYFPPANFVGSDRIDAWAKNLFSHGIKPIIITRNWNLNQKNIVDPIKNNEFKHIINNDYEIYQLPVKRSIRDKLSKYSSLKLIQKAFTFIDLIKCNFVLSNSWNNKSFFGQAKKLIESDSEITSVIISGRPFQNFMVGARLKKKFNIQWIPDYRDDWTTRPSNYPNTMFQKLIYAFDRQSEIRWTKNADFFISVSNYLVQSISEFINTEGYRIMNGFSIKKKSNEEIVSNSNEFIISYIGTLYDYQPIEETIEAFNQVIEESKIKLVIRFIGIDTDSKQKKRVNSLIQKHQDSYQLIDRIPKKDLNSYLTSSDYFFLTSYGELQGCLPVKIFDYLKYQKPILLYPSDNGIIRDFIEETGSGFALTTKNQVVKTLLDAIKKKQRGRLTKLQNDTNNFEHYTREFQTRVLAKLLQIKSNTNN